MEPPAHTIHTCTVGVFAILSHQGRLGLRFPHLNTSMHCSFFFWFLAVTILTCMKSFVLFSCWVKLSMVVYTMWLLVYHLVRGKSIHVFYNCLRLGVYAQLCFLFLFWISGRLQEVFLPSHCLLVWLFSWLYSSLIYYYQLQFCFDFVQSKKHWLRPVSRFSLSFLLCIVYF